MNYRIIFHTTGKVLLVEAGLLALPLLVSVLYHERCAWAVLASMAAAAVIGGLLTLLARPRCHTFFNREGYIIVALAWVLLSAVGALPFWFSREIPSYADAFFETVSGFTTTGASILTDVEAMSHGLLFWRSFTHWGGGMGVLVFITMISGSSARSMTILKAELPGPVVGKLPPRTRDTARVLGRYYDCVVWRTYRQSDLEEFAELAGVPVINGLTDYAHPCQVLADLMTIRERRGTLEGQKLCFIGDGCSMANSLIVGGLLAGMQVTCVCPQSYRPAADVLMFAHKYGSAFLLTADPAEGIQDADVVATAVWNTAKPGTSESEQRLRDFVDDIKYVSHVHISEPGLEPIVPRQEHKELAMLLKAVGYSGDVSIEMKRTNVETVRKTLAYIAEVFA